MRQRPVDSRINNGGTADVVRIGLQQRLESGQGFSGGEGLASSRVLGSATQGHDRGAATLGADLDLKIPLEVAKGSYRATLTITALAG